MSDYDPTTGSHRGPDAGKRWYDPNKMVIAFAGVLLMISSWLGASLWTMARTAELKNAEQDVTIFIIVKQMGEINVKMDRLLERSK